MEANWEVTNFSPGIHTEPRRVAKRELYARDGQNWQVSNTGELRVRFGHTVEGKVASGNITGVIVLERNTGNPVVVILNDLGELRIAQVSAGTITSISTPLVTDVNLSGRLSGVLATDDVTVVTSEGDDRGYWIDLSSYSAGSAAAYPLGFARPVVTSTVLTDIGSGALDADSYYYYRITYYRDVPPFQAKESVSSNILPIRTSVSGSNDRKVRLTPLPSTTEASTGITRMRLWRTEGQAAATSITGTATGGSATTMEDTGAIFLVNLVGRIILNTTDLSEGTITAYTQTSVEFTELVGGTRNNFQAGDTYQIILGTLPFYLVTTVTETTTLYEDGMSDGNLTTKTQFDAVQNATYALPPAGIQSIAWYGDRVWVTGYGTGFRFSVIEDGNPLYWAFAPENEILSYRGRIHSVVNYREILLILGPGAVGRLTGTAVEDFDIDYSSGRLGPVDAWSWIIASDLLFFVSSAGMYIFDGVVPIRFGTAIEQFFAEQAQKPFSGIRMLYLPTNELVIGILHVVNNEYTTLIYNIDEDSWRKAANVDFSQGFGIVMSGTQQVFYGWRGTAYIRRWWHGYEINTLLSPVPTIDETDDVGATQVILWSWKSQKLWFGARGREKFARFLELLIAANSTIHVKGWGDGTLYTNSSFSVTGDPSEPYYVNLEFPGKEIEVEISGAGPVTVQGIRVIGEV